MSVSRLFLLFLVITFFSIFFNVIKVPSNYFCVLEPYICWIYRSTFPNLNYIDSNAAHNQIRDIALFVFSPTFHSFLTKKGSHLIVLGFLSNGVWLQRPWLRRLLGHLLKKMDWLSNNKSRLCNWSTHTANSYF